MNKKLQINLFNSKPERVPMAKKMYEEIANCEYTTDIKLCLHLETHTKSLWQEYFKNDPPKFEVFIVVHPDSSYPNKINFSHQTDCKYSCKLDDDVLTSRYVWNFILENIEKIDIKTPIIAPIFTNGIPSADLFIEDFLTSVELQEAHQILLRNRVLDYEWGLDYTEINKKILTMKKWDSEEYWDFVTKVNTKWEERPVPWFYQIVRGVHPARFSYEYNMFIANKVIEKKEFFFAKHDYSFTNIKAPYFCNNMFICETDFWKKTYDIFYDGWDEGQLTVQMRIDDSQALYIKKGFAIHMAYGHTQNQQLIQNHYISSLCTQ
jgi:hypothetical protein